MPKIMHLTLHAPLATLALLACDATDPDATTDPLQSEEPDEPRAWDSPVPLRVADPFQIRGETKLGCRADGLAGGSWGSLHACAEVEEWDAIDPLTNFDRYIVLEEDSNGFVPMPRMKTKFQVDDETSPLVAITFSAMGRTSEQGVGPEARVRVLIDGQDVADPGAVTFWSARPQPSRWAPTAYSFVFEPSPGIHTVEVQYETDGAHISLRDASLRVDVERLVDSEIVGVPPTSEGLFGETSALNTTTVLPAVWSPLPGGGLDFVTGGGEEALLVLSPTFMSSGGHFFVRARVDGVPAYPSRFGFDPDQELAARSISFTVPNLAAGNHHVDWEWYSLLPGNPATVTLETLTELAVVGPTSDPDYVVRTAEQSVGMVMVEDDNVMVDEHGVYWPIDPYRAIPGLETRLDLEEISDASITVTASYSGDRVVFIAPTIDGEVLRDQEILFGAEADENAGARSYTFAVKDIPAGEDTVIGLAARSAPGNPAGQSMLGSGTAGFLIKRRVGPDLAVGAKIGVASKTPRP